MIEAEARAHLDPFAEFQQLIDAVDDQRPVDQAEVNGSLDSTLRKLFEDVASDTSRDFAEVTGRLQQMAMVLGATACSHEHLQSLANEMGGRYGGMEDPDLHHDHVHDTEQKEAQRGKKKKNKTFTELLAQLFTRQPTAKKWFFSL